MACYHTLKYIFMPIIHISMCNLILRWYNRRNVNTNSLQFKWLFKALTSLFRHNKDARGMIFAIEVQLWILLEKNYCHKNAIKCFWARAINHTIRVTMTLWTYSLNRYTLCIRFVFLCAFRMHIHWTDMWYYTVTLLSTPINKK